MLHVSNEKWGQYFIPSRCDITQWFCRPLSINMPQFNEFVLSVSLSSLYCISAVLYFYAFSCIFESLSIKAFENSLAFSLRTIELGSIFVSFKKIKSEKKFWECVFVAKSLTLDKSNRHFLYITQLSFSTKICKHGDLFDLQFFNPKTYFAPKI